MYGDKTEYEDDDKLCALVFRAFKQSKEALEPFFKKCNRSYKMYHGKHALDLFSNNPTSYPWKYQVFIPTILGQVETAVPRLANGLLENEPLFEEEPQLLDGEREAEPKLAHWAKLDSWLKHNQLTTDVHIEQHLGPWIRDSWLYGIQWLWLDWMTRRGPTWKQVEKGPYGGKWEFKQTSKDALLEDRIRITPVDIWSMRPDPRARGRDFLRFLGRQMIVPADWLWSFIQGTPGKGWKITSRNELDSVCGEIRGEHDQLYAMRGEVGKVTTEGGEGWVPKDEDKNLVLVCDYWEPGPEGRHVMVAGRQAQRPKSAGAKKDSPYKLLLDGPNEFKNCRLPAVSLVPQPLANELHGLGTDDTINALGHYVNMLVNMRASNIVRATNQTWLVNTMSGLSAQQFLSQPAGAWNVNGAIPLDQCIKAFNWPIVDNESRQEVDYYMQQQQVAGGGTDFAQGVGAQRFNETARGVLALLEQGGERYTLQFKQLVADLSRLGETMHGLNQQFIDKPRLVKILGPTGATLHASIDPRVIARRYAITFSASPRVSNKSMARQDWANFMQQHGASPVLNQVELAKHGLKLQGIKRPGRFLNAQQGDPDWENLYWHATGRFPEVQPNDNDYDHLERHGLLFVNGGLEGVPEAAQRELKQHTDAHMRRIQMLGPVGGAGQPGRPSAPGPPSQLQYMQPQGQMMGGGGLPPMRPTGGQPGGQVVAQ